MLFSIRKQMKITCVLQNFYHLHIWIKQDTVFSGKQVICHLTGSTGHMSIRSDLLWSEWPLPFRLSCILLCCREEVIRKNKRPKAVVLKLFCPIHSLHHKSEYHSAHLSKIVGLKRCIPNNMHISVKIFSRFHI